MNIGPRQKRILKISGVIIASLLILYFIFRNPLLHWATGKVLFKVKKSTGATMTIGNSHFSGLTTVELKDIVVVPVSGDTIFTADDIQARISVWTLFLATIRLKELIATGVDVNISCRKDVCNYESF